MGLYKCQVCNLIVEGDMPEVCPKCGVAHKFVLVEEPNKVYDSEKTNVLLADLVSLATKLIEISNEGKDINLDPTCYKVFDLVLNKAWDIKQLAKSEIESHVKKNKW